MAAALPAATLLAAALLATGAASSAAAQAASPAAPEPPPLTLREAVLQALEHNPSLRVQRLVPEIRRTAVEEELGLLDPRLSAQAGHSWPAAPAAAGSGLEAGLALTLPTGTSLAASLAAGWDPLSSAYDLRVTQALLAGGRLAANLARVRQARLDLRASEHELRGFTETLLASVQRAYWGHYLALREREIFRESLALAERQLEESRVRAQVGQLAPSELAAPRAEVVSRGEALRQGEVSVDATRLALLQAIRPAGADLEETLSLADAPAAPQGPLDELSRHVRLALDRRPELLQARLELERGELEVARTRNGLLPRLDFFLALGGSGGGTGYTGSFADTLPAALEDSTLSAGLTLELALGNRSARAAARRAVLGRSQAEQSLRALEATVEVDTRTAWLEAGLAAEQVSTSAELRRLQEQTLLAETEKFRAGTSTTFLVAQAQRDLLASQLAEAQAAVGYLLAVVNLYRLEGSLLERSRIQTAD
jgi:outer membrane protein TolC